MFESLIETVEGGYQAKRHRDLLVAIWEQERWFDTPHQRATAEMARDLLQQARLSDVRLAAYPCDGRTRYQDWIMHMAWDCPSARLAFADSGQVLADREQVPAAVANWSGPLASADEPAVAELVDGDALETITPEAADGKFILTAKPPVEMKRRLVAAGAKPLAVVSDYLGEGRGYTEQTTKWCNTWSDGPGGWYFHADDTVMAGFCLSPAAGKLLRKRLTADPNLKLAGYCNARLYEGPGQNVTAVLEGTDPSREVWIFGHACEQGGHDNCSGVSILIESLRTLKELIVAGKLARPRYSIRMITTEECIGMVAFASRHGDLRRRALVGLNVDAGGDPAPPDHPYVLHHGPWSNPTIGWAVGGLICAVLRTKAGEGWHIQHKHFVPSADDMIADPGCGIPAMWLGKGGTSLGYHSSSDTPDVCSDDSLRYNTLLTAAWAYAMASMDERLAAEVIGPATEWIDENIIRPGADDPALLPRWVGGRMLRDLARWGVSHSVYEPAAAKYAAADAPPLPDLPTDGPRYIRSTWGTCTFETLPAERRRDLSRWSAWITAGLYWNDGRRPLPAVERLARAETGTKPESSLKNAFEACVEAGMMVQDNSGNYPRT
jgi:hypothetical protein